MCNKSNLPHRAKKANAACNFVSVVQRDSENKVRAITVPGSNGKTYHVIIRRNRGVSTELNLVVNGSLVKPKYAAQITYHQMTAIQIAAKEQGYTVTWCANRQDAVRLANLGGKVFQLRNHNNPQSVMWGVMKKGDK